MALASTPEIPTRDLLEDSRDAPGTGTVDPTVRPN